MKTFDLKKIIRKNIQEVKAYSSARSEYSGEGTVLLDANENNISSALGLRYNRYPDPLQSKLKAAISKIKGIPAENIFIGNGSDEPIDLLIRACCIPGEDNILIFPPTYGIYEVTAGINDVQVKKVLLTEQFQIDVDKAVSATDSNTKLIFVCSPNNPTGNLINKESIISLLNAFSGLVVMDEAYIDFANDNSLLNELLKHPNLVVLQTFSKAWGLAGLRLGAAYGSKELVEILNKIKPPYNVNLSSQQLALEALRDVETVKSSIKTIKEQRAILIDAIARLPFVKTIYPSDANFLLVKVTNANDLYTYLLKQKIVVRNRSSMPLCENCIRITIGNSEDNIILLNALRNYLA